MLPLSASPLPEPASPQEKTVVPRSDWPAGETVTDLAVRSPSPLALLEPLCFFPFLEDMLTSLKCCPLVPYSLYVSTRVDDEIKTSLTNCGPRHMSTSGSHVRL